MNELPSTALPQRINNNVYPSKQQFPKEVIRRECDLLLYGTGYYVKIFVENGIRFCKYII